MNNGYINGNISIAGIGFPVAISAQDEGAINHSVVAPMAYAGVVTSGVGTKAGVITTTNAAPTIDTDDYVDVYWEIAGVKGVLYNADVSNVTAGAITIIDTNGKGNNLPANASACIIAVQKVVTGEFLGTDVSMMFTKASAGRSHVSFVEGSEAAGAVHFGHDVPDDEGWFWADTIQIVNPITGDTIDHIWVSTADITSDQTIIVAVLYDSVA